ncbi:coniferyl aldehyde dehydrogenase [Blastomonas aquatica]|uniref:Aldehyde dehydrogenase n=1 Tax=Blastomonas aquatica TaxID=1510276 RepID=A0ABQ1JHK6_9SPHN|nr:coniferyl aldehyde dehydrogenase [Blastomonas aquatica]GGB66516.1 aldehyde dehydrogenase [Blastomonas aquatica]
MATKTDAPLQADHLSDVLDRQKAAFLAELPVPMSVRKDRIKRIMKLVHDNADALVAAMSEDFGHRSADQSKMTDIVSVLNCGRHALKHMDNWAKSERRPVQFPLGILGARARVEYQPLGVVGIIAPWNFPIQLCLTPAIGALAAGNRVMIKNSEFTENTSNLLAELGPQFFDASEVAFFTGGPDVGKAFSELPFNHLLFTGATSVGHHIMRAAANNLVPVTLELGGKSPAIIGRGADKARAAQRVTMGKMLNAGQICIAPDYLYVPREDESEIIDNIKQSASTLYPTLLTNDDYTAVVNERHHERLSGYLDDAREKGAEVIEVNPAGEDFKSANSRKMPLHILRNVTDDMKVMQDEIFGPILPIKTYSTVDEAIDYVNGRDRPLALYYFGEDAAEAKKVTDRTVSGGVTLNDTIFHVAMEDLPFGGVGPSGMGAYHGLDGFRTFSHAKSIYSQPRIDVAKLAGFLPPYGNATKKAIERDLKL